MPYVITWDLLVGRELFKWAGLAAILHSLLHKNWERIQTIASQFNGRQLHGRRLKVWRWEALIYDYFRENHPGITWISVGQDNFEWA